MRGGGTVPLSYADMAAAYPDLFTGGEAARKALARENPGQSPIEEYLIGVVRGFRRGAIGELALAASWETLSDATRLDPLAWLIDHIGDVRVVL